LVSSGLCLNGHEVPAGAAVCPTCWSPLREGPPGWHLTDGSTRSTPVPEPPVSHGESVPPDQAGEAPDVQAATNSFALASLLLGILWVYWVGAILAVIFGHIALHQIKQRNEKGHGLAVAGLIFGYLWLAFGVVVLVAKIQAG
jgi:hypothetical protein